MDRAERVRARLDDSRALALQASKAGPPCSSCRYGGGGYCSNIAYAEQSFDPVTGSLSERYNTRLPAARSSEGLCGPEALLFEPKPDIVVWATHAWNFVATVWTTIILGGLALFFLYEMLR